MDTTGRIAATLRPVPMEAHAPALASGDHGNGSPMISLTPGRARLQRGTSWDRSWHSKHSSGASNGTGTDLQYDEFGDGENRSVINQLHNQSIYLRSRCEQWDIRQEDLKMVRKIDDGDFGEIYEAVWRGTQVCAKTVEGKTQDELWHELKLWSHLRHPNLVMFMGSVLKQEPFIVVSEYMPGGTLLKRCKEQVPPFSLFLKWAFELAKVLCFLHNCHPPVVHNNLKPSNLMLSAEDHLSVTDFSHSKVMLKKLGRRGRGMSRDKSEAAKSRWTAKLMGRSVDSEAADQTYDNGARYASPEALKGHTSTPDWDRTDIWSFGMVLFFMATGTHPHEELPTDKAVELLQKGQIPDLKKISYGFGEIQELITAMTRKEPGARPNIQTVHAEVKRWAEIYKGKNDVHQSCKCTVS